MTTLFYKATVYKLTDLSESKVEHKSISGGKATHSFNFIEERKADNLAELESQIESVYGKSYDECDGVLYYGIPEKEWENQDCPEDYEVIFEKVQTETIGR
jgi:hypothetical protein